MRKNLFIILATFVVAAVGSSSLGQAVERLAAPPRVSMQIATPEFHLALFPEWYEQQSVTHDFSWLLDNSLGLQAFWAISGDSVLRTLSSFAGLEWPAAPFSILLVRYFPSVGSADPCIAPVGGIFTGQGIVAAPTGLEAELNLYRLLARRLLAQSTPAELVDHPVLRAGSIQQEQIVMHLAIATAKAFNADSSIDRALESAFWRTYWRGQEIRQTYLADWELTPDRPLLAYVRTEPRNSDFARVEREKEGPPVGATRQASAEIPDQSELGLAVTFESGKRFLVRSIDPTRAAYAGGLRQGDRITSIDNNRPATERELVLLLIKGSASAGCIVQVEREGKSKLINFKPRTAVK